MIAARWLRLVVGVFAAATIGILAASLQVRGWAPLGLLPMLVGVAVGGILFAVSRARIWSRDWLIVGAIVLSLLAVLSEHAWLYRDFRRQWRDARADNAQVAMFRSETPWSPAEYLEHEYSRRRAVLWSLDALVVAAAAVATSLYLQRPLLTAENVPKR